LAVFVLRPGDSGAMTMEEIFQLGLVVVFAAVLMATSQAFTQYRSSRHADVPALAVILRAERPTFLLFERVLVPREMSALIPAASDQPIDAVANGKDRKTCTSDRPGGSADVFVLTGRVLAISPVIAGLRRRGHRRQSARRLCQNRPSLPSPLLPSDI
jgi:hypothetical protein